MKKEKYYDKISKINIFTINERSGILSPAKVDKYNDRILDLLSIYLNLNSDFKINLNNQKFRYKNITYPKFKYKKRRTMKLISLSADIFLLICLY